MIKNNRDLISVPNSTVLWKYMSLAKFMFLIHKKKLHFQRADLFSDEKECTLSIIDKGIFGYSPETEAYWNKERKRHFISCWIDSPCELALMWNCYGKDGVAIKTTASSLKNSCESDSSHKCYLSKVKYIDFKDGGSSQNNGKPINILKLLFTKRIFFSQEKEVRLLYSDYKDISKTGYDLPVDISLLIEKIIISPYADDFLKDEIVDSLDDKKLKESVQESSI